jgi:26S proteasome regulatory subunit N7
MTEESNTKMDVDEKETPKETIKGENVTPSASGENASKYPDMKLAQSIHQVIMTSKGKTVESCEEIKSAEDILKQVIEEMENPSLYRHLTANAAFQSTGTVSESDLVSIEEKNVKAVEELEKKVEEAKENAGDMEVLDARFEVAKFAAKSLSKDKALEAYEKVLALPKLSSGKVMDALMDSARITSFYDDLVKNAELVQKISKLADESGDWDRRNRVKVYTALTKILARDVKTSASLLIDCIATFSCTEFCTYTEFIVYTIITNILFLSRTDLKKKIIDGPEILSVAKDIPQVIKLVNTLYDCDYKGYLHAMVDVEPILLGDRFLQAHCGYIMRELHVLGYKQFLDSYKSVTLDSMAASFGVSVNFLDLQLGRFIAAGRLTAKIDKFGGVVETNRPDLKNAQYRDMIQEGDLLLNRIQKLARVVDL